MRKFLFTYLYIIIFVGLSVFLASCKPSLPSDVLSSGKMEDILYDFHIAQTMAEGDPKMEIAYETAVFKKHDISKAEFDSSLVYYERHTELLHKVYEKLAERLNDEAVAVGASATDLSNGMIAGGDTANIWRGVRAMVFTPEKPFNYYGFEVHADSSYHKGDRIILDFDAQFIYQDGARDGIALLAIVFNNDSVASQTVHISGSSHYNAIVEDHDSLGIKQVRGMFLLNKSMGMTPNDNSTTLKLMILQNIRLLKMHVKNNPQPAQEAEPQSAPHHVGQSATRQLPIGSPLPSPSQQKGLRPDRIRLVDQSDLHR